MASRADDGRALRLAITSFYLPSESKIGVGWVTHRLANELVQLGHEVTVISPSARPDDAAYHHQHVMVERPLRTFRWGLQLRNIDWSRFDGLLAQGDDHLIPRGAVAAHVRTLHGSCFDEARYVRGTRERVRMAALGLTEVASALRTRHVVGVSRASIRMFPWLDDVIPNGVDIHRFSPEATSAKEDRPTVLFVGTYRQRKRGRLLHEAFTRYVRPRVPEARLWMVCSDAPPAPGVEVLGRVSDDALADLYRRAWVFALPSTYEGFGVPYIEAMASGTAVVATPNRGAVEVLDHGRRGVLVSPERLGEAIVDVLVDPAHRRRLELAGLAARPEYDMTVIAKAYVDRVRRQLARV